MLQLVLALMLSSWSLNAASSPGWVVWWGQDPVSGSLYSGHTNGVITDGKEIATNIVAVAARAPEVLALRSDGSVLVINEGFYGKSEMSVGLTNVASIALEGNSAWAIRKDGTVAQWGNDQDEANVVAGLSNVAAIAWAGSRNYLALKHDGTVWGFRFDNGHEWFEDSPGEPPVRPVRVNGKSLTNVAAMTSGEMPLILKQDGTLFRLGFHTPGKPPPEPVVTKIDELTVAIDLGGEIRKTPYQYTTADPVIVGGQVLSNVVAITPWGQHDLALKRDGTLVAFGAGGQAGSQVPQGLSNIVALAPGLALLRDGTVTAWGDNHYGQTSIPAGLSNVVAIAAGGMFNLAITTGAVPPSVYIAPRGRLEEMAAAADLVFKGKVLSSIRATNSAFQNPQMDVHATRFQVISVLKGDPTRDSVILQHYTIGPGAWGGGSPPPYYQFEAGKSYLVFAARLDKPDTYYNPGPETKATPAQFRQLANGSRKHDDGFLRTLDARPMSNRTIKDAYWHELSLLLNDTQSTNKLYAVGQLDALSLACVESWLQTDDFPRERVLKALGPFLTDRDEKVALAATECFQVGSECATQLLPHVSTLLQIASGDASVPRRAAAIAAFGGTSFPELTNSLSRWLDDPADEVRAQATFLLPGFSGQFVEQGLRRLATDRSARVRASVADAIGNKKFVALIPTLATLFRDPVGRTNPVPPLTLEDVQGGGRTWGTNNADVHTSAGYALLQFELDDVADILKANLDDAGFRPQFLCKLAQKGAGPWLEELVKVMEERRRHNEQQAAASGIPEKESYLQALLHLSGTYYETWNIIFEYLRERPGQEFVNGKFDRCLDVLENAGTTGSREPVMLYELYRTKGLDQRAANYRRHCEQTFSYDVGRYFKQVDDTLKPAR